MTMIAGPKGTRYCVDRTEVTQGQYKQFVDAVGGDLTLISKVAICAYQTTYDVIVQPGNDYQPFYCPKGVYDPLSKSDQPMECVTWCSAYAFCQWAGKRLCGKIGGGALADPEKDGNDAEKSQWYTACSQGGKYAYQYGDTYLPSCSPTALGPVANQAAECRAKEPAFSEMSGMSSGVTEWEDGCLGNDCLTGHRR
jgi:sulfatase modifying factor 1